MSNNIDVELAELKESRAAAKANLDYLKRKISEYPGDSHCWREGQILIKEGEELLNNLDEEEASLILGDEWDTCSVLVIEKFIVRDDPHYPDGHVVHDSRKRKQPSGPRSTSYVPDVPTDAVDVAREHFFSHSRSEQFSKKIPVLLEEQVGSRSRYHIKYS